MRQFLRALAIALVTMLAFSACQGGNDSFTPAKDEDPLLAAFVWLITAGQQGGDGGGYVPPDGRLVNITDAGKLPKQQTELGKMEYPVAMQDGTIVYRTGKRYELRRGDKVVKLEGSEVLAGPLSPVDGTTAVGSMAAENANRLAFVEFDQQVFNLDDKEFDKLPDSVKVTAKAAGNPKQPKGSTPPSNATTILTPSQYDPAVNPGGGEVAFVNQGANGRNSLMLARVTAGGILTDRAIDVPTPGGSNSLVTDVAWLDEETLVVAAGTGTESRLWRVPIDGSEPEQLTNSKAARDPAVSADGCVLFSSDTGKGGDIYIMNADGSGQTPLVATPDNEVSPVAGGDMCDFVKQ